MFCIKPLNFELECQLSCLTTEVCSCDHAVSVHSKELGSLGGQDLAVCGGPVHVGAGRDEPGGGVRHGQLLGHVAGGQHGGTLGGHHGQVSYDLKAMCFSIVLKA